MKLAIAGAQIPVCDDIAQNTQTLLRAIDQAHRAGAGILLTPEGSLSGYRHDFVASEAQAALAQVTAAAVRAGLALALGTCFVEPADGRCYNQLRFYAADGTYLGFHAKTNLCGSLGQPPAGEIQHYATKPLEIFRLAGLPVGGLICNDMWANPLCSPLPDTHLSQQLAQLGARVIFHAVNAAAGRDGFFETYRAYHESNLRMRARAGGVWIVTADNCHPTPHAPVVCPSGIVSPDGQWACQAPMFGEHVFVHSIDTAT